MSKIFAIPSQPLRKGWSWGPDYARLVQCRLLSDQEYRDAHMATGSIYFIVDVFNDTVKIGHSGDVGRRLRQIKTGNPSPLKVKAVVAARREIEPAIHALFGAHALEGEWFTDEEYKIAKWLKEMTFDQPWQRCQWLMAGARSVTWQWDEATRSHKALMAERP